MPPRSAASFRFGCSESVCRGLKWCWRSSQVVVVVGVLGFRSRRGARGARRDALSWGSRGCCMLRAAYC
eukprot:2209280-Alexandrium_andersonii.AAC.1